MASNTSSNWDAGRFLRTLAFFETVPFLGNVGWIRQLLEGLLPLSQQPVQKDRNLGSENLGVILVVGATGGVGQRVVKRLLQQGYPVRALVRDLERAKTILGDRPQLVAGDVTQPETLKSEFMQGVQAVISCLGTRVEPVEGDTSDRAKYRQGVQFYQPMVVGSTPEAVEYQGVQNLLAIAKPHFSRMDVKAEKLVFDFRQPNQPLQQLWGALDDVVMGGVSESNLKFISGVGLFAGNVSTANSGGFASVRTKNLTPPLDLTDYEGIELRVCGDGKRYKFFIRSDDRWDGVGYAYSFDTVPNIWMTVRIPFSELIPVFRAKTAPTATPFNPSQVYSLQLMLSKFEYDGALNPKFTAGEFSLQLETIKAYGGPILPRWIMVSSAGVTRPGRPGLDLAQEPPAVRLNDQLGGILTWKLRGEDAVRASGLHYTIIRPCALTEESGGQKLKFDQGDNLKGKVSREDIAELCVQALTLPQSRNLTFEVATTEDGQAGDWANSLGKLQ
jgi:uncharacterized protein YbjT (DUF2867 family)